MHCVIGEILKESLPLRYFYWFLFILFVNWQFLVCYLLHYPKCSYLYSIVQVKASQAQRVVEEINKNYSKKATCYVFKGVDGASQIQV